MLNLISSTHCNVLFYVQLVFEEVTDVFFLLVSEKNFVLNCFQNYLKYCQIYSQKLNFFFSSFQSINMTTD